MKYSEALEIVHELATQNQIDETDVAFGDEGLEPQRVWQAEALETLHDLVVNKGEDIDDRFEAAPLIDVGIEDVAADRAMDASEPQAAIRICLDLARDAVLDDDSEEMAHEVARQEEAVSTVENFIVAHGDALDASLTTLKM